MSNGPLKRPGRTGVRIGGDRYQWLVAWSACVSALRGQDLEANPVVAVGVEVDGAGNLDDVVVFRESPPHTFMQVKYTVDFQHPVDSAYLTDPSKAGGPSILKKMHSARKKLSVSGDPVDLVLMTNRAPDPRDPLVSVRDSRTGLLLPTAGEDGPMSKKGKARKQWAIAAEMNGDELTSLLSVLRFELAQDVAHVEEMARLQMMASGLRADSAALTTGIGWVEEQVIAGERRLNAETIEHAVDELGLRQGRARSILAIATLKPHPLAHQAAHHLDWVDRFDGADPFSKRRPLPPATWEQLQRDIEDIPSHLGGASHVLVSGSMRLPAAFTVGAALRMVTNLDLAVVQRQDVWSTDSIFTDPVAPSLAIRPVGRGTEIAVVVQIAAPIAEDVLEFINEQGLPIDKMVVVSPPGGENDSAISGSAAANALAFGIRNAVRPQVRRCSRIHLFMAAPMGLALLLGHRWNAMGPSTEVYEDLVQLGYERAFTIDG